MTQDIINLIKENVVQGRVTQDDEGLDEGMVGKPGVTELIDEALAAGIGVKDVINKGLTAGMEIVGEKFVPWSTCRIPLRPLKRVASETR